MQKFVVFTLLALLVSGGIVAFIMYKQLGTDTTTLSASPELVASAEGECGEVALSVGARTLGQWYLDVPKAKTISGRVYVDGGESSDVGFSIWSPSNRAVFFDSQRTHESDFVVENTVRGEYRFDIDNRHSTFSGKDVTVALCLA